EHVQGTFASLIPAAALTGRDRNDFVRWRAFGTRTNRVRGERTERWANAKRQAPCVPNGRGMTSTRDGASNQSERTGLVGSRSLPPPQQLALSRDLSRQSCRRCPQSGLALLAPISPCAADAGGSRTRRCVVRSTRRR